MQAKFKKIGLIGKLHTPDVVDVLEEIISFLQKFHVKILLEDKTAKVLNNKNLLCYSRDNLCKNCDLLIVIGGDGILLSVAQSAAPYNKPVLGINRGRLGFLTDIMPEKITKIEKILAGDYILEERFLLHAKVLYQNKIIAEDIALNEVILMMKSTARLGDFSLYINNEFVCDYHADGLIIATPTGSTAHALSSGGPILHSNLDAVVLVPMLSHNLSSRPVVISNNSKIKLLNSEKNKEAAQIICDGRKGLEVPIGASINIIKAKNKLRLLHPKDYNYFETLRVKLNWER